MIEKSTSHPGREHFEIQFISRKKNLTIPSYQKMMIIHSGIICSDLTLLTSSYTVHTRLSGIIS